MAQQPLSHTQKLAAALHHTKHASSSAYNVGTSQREGEKKPFEITALLTLCLMLQSQFVTARCRQRCSRTGRGSVSERLSKAGHAGRSWQSLSVRMNNIPSPLQQRSSLFHKSLPEELLRIHQGMDRRIPSFQTLHLHSSATFQTSSVLA